METSATLAPNLVLLALIGLFGAAAYYVHRELARRVPPGRALRNTRIILGATAVAFGWITARVVGLTSPGLNFFLVFLASAAVVHVPAACILWLKAEKARQERDD
ncbi:hypothetical protein J2T57_002665 [Natronocella acetinitrilica]|uniref:Uncharacterized protein n=1 Tax=Natronocella acetinitrilica TaxID=414046 RepID=A0AAE3KBG6_9GAMM|nr:hypothetical protein [Natronocella acetinitrilica]MCP1675515.1 hypothetical protein [Natronocella acetinitrilica]